MGIAEAGRQMQGMTAREPEYWPASATPQVGGRTALLGTEHRSEASEPSSLSMWFF
jgi:hypothetical protein